MAGCGRRGRTRRLAVALQFWDRDGHLARAPSSNKIICKIISKNKNQISTLALLARDM
jgi:hypothetical protein